MDDTPIEDPPGTPPPGLDGTVRFLKILVTTLTVTTIVGLIVLISVIVMRVQDMGGAQTGGPVSFDQLTLPDGGAAAIGFTKGGRGWHAVVTDDDRILIYDSETGTLRQEITVEGGQ